MPELSSGAGTGDIQSSPEPPPAAPDDKATVAPAPAAPAPRASPTLGDESLQTPTRVSFSEIPPSPTYEAAGEESGPLERKLVRSLSRGRHTVTRAVAAEILDEVNEAESEKDESVSPSTGSCLRAGVRSIQGARNEMEDAHRAVIPGDREAPTPRTPGGSKLPSRGDRRAENALLGFFGVFDGHGGKRAAEFVEANLYEAFVARWRASSSCPPEPSTPEAACAASKTCCGPSRVEEALRLAFSETESQLIQISKEQEWMDGTTAAVAVVVEDRATGSRAVVAGNVGDSEVLLGGRNADGQFVHEVLSELHNMGRNASERDRVEAVGGRVYRGRLGHPRFNPRFASLAVSRALGDLFFKDPELTDSQPSGLSAEPFLVRRELSSGDKFIIIGCDGFFDTVAYPEAVEFAFARLDQGEDPDNVSSALVELAMNKGSTDNITVVMVAL
eukprot:TRINITY_DN90744_c0_g1_i1.p1 TRINITY_DN90744_c0_g1~~TRINITY_DN90744_c0_g1_i1.p1  ORF type:complete len:446 (-),score=77.66 TRINITY_DN90744_c0_g1_i1:98-1435(-)